MTQAIHILGSFGSTYEFGAPIADFKYWNVPLEAYELDETEGMWPMKYWMHYDKS